MKLLSVVLALAVGVVACSSRYHGLEDGTDGLNGSGASSSSGSSGSSESGSSGAGASGSVSLGDPNYGADAAVHALYGDADIPDGAADEPVTLTMDAFTVQPQQEVYMCQQFANPFGRDVDVIKMDGYMDKGSHHFFLFNMSPGTGRNVTAPLGPCPGAGLEFHPFPFLSQTSGHYIVTYPQPNMGYPVAAANGLTMNVHYLNTGSMPITPVVSITIWPAHPGVVTTHIGSIFLNNLTIHVPAIGGPTWYSAQNTPITSENYTIFTNWAHLHSSSNEFQAIANGTVFYDLTSSLTEPPLQTTSAMLPMQMKAGTPITWQCNYTGNGTDRPFGDSATGNVMCIYIGQYYPADKTSPSYPDIVSVLN